MLNRKIQQKNQTSEVPYLNKRGASVYAYAHNIIVKAI